MSEVQSGTLDVRDARLYYEIRGQGPPILLIQGGISEAGSTEQLASRLAQDHQVISYDRRGLSRSTADGDLLVTMDLHAEDAARLLAALTAEPAVVLASSIGALIALHVAVEHPERVATVIAHEPPMSSVVHDPTREDDLDTVATMASTDVRGAIRHMATVSNHQVEREDGARPPAPAGDVDANLQWFFAHDFPAVRGSTLTAEALRAVPSSTTVVPTCGREGQQRWEQQCAQQLAKELHRACVELPGGHDAPTTHPGGLARAVPHLFPWGSA